MTSQTLANVVVIAALFTFLAIMLNDELKSHRVRKQRHNKS